MLVDSCSSRERGPFLGVDLLPAAEEPERPAASGNGPAEATPIDGHAVRHLVVQRWPVGLRGQGCSAARGGCSDVRQGLSGRVKQEVIQLSEHFNRSAQEAFLGGEGIGGRRRLRRARPGVVQSGPDSSVRRLDSR
jgi:hypothetical protein